MKLQPGELTLVHCKLDSSVDDGTALLVDKGLVDQLTVVGGVVKVITKEDKQYVNIPVLNEAAHLQSKYITYFEEEKIYAFITLLSYIFAYAYCLLHTQCDTCTFYVHK